MWIMMGMGMTHAVKNSKTSNATTDRFQFMTFLRAFPIHDVPTRRGPQQKKRQMICKNENFAPLLGLGCGACAGELVKTFVYQVSASPVQKMEPDAELRRGDRKSALCCKPQKSNHF